jgi:hypothetical protein
MTAGATDHDEAAKAAATELRRIEKTVAALREAKRGACDGDYEPSLVAVGERLEAAPARTVARLVGISTTRGARSGSISGWTLSPPVAPARSRVSAVIGSKYCNVTDDVQHDESRQLEKPAVF